MHPYSERMSGQKTSIIRELLKLTQRDDVISFAGGLPAPELFPVEEMKAVTIQVLDTMGEEAMQYSTTEGYNPLRDHILERMAAVGIESTRDNVLVTSGSQQGLEFTGKIFLDKGDVVICESPTYLGAINAFRSYQGEFAEVETDEYGMDIDDLEKVIKENPRAKFIYVIPDFQNPSSTSWSMERRQGLIEMANKYDLIIVEDSPYAELRFEGDILPAVKSLDTEDRVIYLGTFSKTFAPGMRIGWVCASEEKLGKFIAVKQGSDLQSTSMTQRQLSVYLDNHSIEEHIEKIKEVYRGRRDLMVVQMREKFPEWAKFSVPHGGLFLWVTLPEGVDTTALMKTSLETEKVAFVPGESFFPNSMKNHHMRVNFSNMDEEKIVEGIKRLGKLLKQVEVTL